MDTIKIVCDTISASMVNTPVHESSSVCQMCTLCLPLAFFFLCLAFSIFYYFWRKRKYYHDLSRKTKPTHVWCQVVMLGFVLLIFLWVCGWCAYYHKSTDMLTWLAGAGVLLTWMFQDVIKNVVAFVSLIFNGVLHIGDWIILEKLGIDGTVADISLTSVIVENWDGTLSSISTQSLLNTQMQNLQNVVAQKTSGRRMQRNFLIDIHSVHDLTEEQLIQLKKQITELDGDDSAVDYAIANGEHQNLRIFRLYLRHWMLSQDTVTRSPKFAIRLFDQTAEGLPMQVYAFLLPTGWEDFEQEQARIVEHIIGAIGIFGLVLFQYPAGTDTNKVELKKEGKK